VTKEKVIVLIKQLPKEALPAVLMAIVRECLVKKVYHGREVSDIVATLEKNCKGEK